MNALERLRTLGTPQTRCEATGRLIKERLDGGRPFFLRERKSIGDGRCSRIRNALSAEINIQNNNCSFILIYCTYLFYSDGNGWDSHFNKILCFMRNTGMLGSLLKYLDKRRQSINWMRGQEVLNRNEPYPDRLKFSV